MIGMTAANRAATTVSVFAIFNAVGRVVCGFISDKIGRVNTLTFCLVLAIIGLLLVWKSGTGTPSAAMYIVGLPGRYLFRILHGRLSGIYG